jgi:hypothetical protein
MTRLLDRATGAVIGALLLGFVAVLASVVGAGPLDPPSGPGPTMKTLQEVEPRTPLTIGAVAQQLIDQPGSYYLTANVNRTATSPAILITADRVTIDLNGFSIVNGGTGTSAIVAGGVGTRTGIAIRNGTIRGFTSSGIDLGAARDVVIEDVVLDATGTGVSSTGEDVVARRVTAQDGSIGLSLAGARARVEDCVVEDNTLTGISVAAYAVITDCTVSSNGSRGIQAEAQARVDGCVIEANGFHGIQVGDNSIVSNCSVTFSGGTGITVGTYSRLTNVSANNNSAHGIFLGSGSSVDGCTTRQNSLHGVLAVFDSIIRNCVAVSNLQAGISAGQGALVQNCAAHSNLVDGIGMSNGSVAELNDVTHNAGSGIHATGTVNRIERNHARANGIGVDVDTTNGLNTIIGNTSFGNTTANYDVAATGNAFGPVIPVANVGANTNPSANYGP